MEDEFQNLDKKKRTRTEVIYDILKTIRDKGGKMKPTHLMYKANLSHQSMKSYLSQLIEKGLIKKKKSDINTSGKDQKFLLERTDKGIDFCAGYSKTIEFERTFGI